MIYSSGRHDIKMGSNSHVRFQQQKPSQVVRIETLFTWIVFMEDGFGWGRLCWVESSRWQSWKKHVREDWRIVEVDILYNINESHSLFDLGFNTPLLGNVLIFSVDFLSAVFLIGYCRSNLDSILSTTSNYDVVLSIYRLFIWLIIERIINKKKWNL